MRLILVTVLVSVAVGLATGGSLRDFPGQPIRWGGVALAGVAAQFVVLRGSWAFALLALSFVLLIAFAAANIRHPGFVLILLGLGLNAAVILANHGMPVTEAAIRVGDVLVHLGMAWFVIAAMRPRAVPIPATTDAVGAGEAP